MSRFPIPESEPSASTRWSTSAFLAEMRSFVVSAIGPATLTQHKLRGWSTVLTARSEEGLFWAKQNCPSQAFEAALLDELVAIVPDRVVPLRAVDRTRGLLLIPDQGAVHPTMTDDLALWTSVVREWALLQREVAPYVDRLGAAGVSTLTPCDCADMLRERAAALHALPVSDPRRLADPSYDAIRGLGAEVDRAVDVVGALGLPLTLNHNDLHGGNVFTGAGSPGRAGLRFFDLADAMLTEPMAALLNPLNLLRQALGCAAGDPRLWCVAEAHLEVWSDVADLTSLRRALPHALLLARLPRHEAWLRVTTAMSPYELDEWGSAPARTLAAMADEPLLTGRGVG